MDHEMKLNPQPFELIKQGYKTIELRLNDEKRQMLQTEDRIVFTKTTDSAQRLTAQIVALHRFRNFDELYRSLPLDRCGYLPHELTTAHPSDMEIYYSAEQQARYGVLGIEIVLLR